MSEENNIERPERTGQPTWVWMILSVVLIGAFLAWLAVASEPTQMAVVEEDTASSVPAVPLDTFAVEPIRYAGQEVRLEEVSVVSRLGSQTFWIELPGEQGFTQPYLVKLGSALVRDSFEVQSGQDLQVIGEVYSMTDSILNIWEETGVLESADQRMEAEFASSFLDVSEAKALGGDSVETDGAEQAQ